MTPEQAQERDRLLRLWHAAQKASIRGPRGQAMTQEEIDEMRRLQAKEDKARRALDDFDVTHGLSRK